MPDEAMTIEVCEVEPYAETGFLARLRELRGPHLFQRLRLQNRAARSSPAGKQNAQESTEIFNCRVHAPGGADSELKRRRFEYAAVNSPHVSFSKILYKVRSRLKAAVAQAQGIKHRALEIACKRLALGFL